MAHLFLKKKKKNQSERQLYFDAESPEDIEEGNLLC